MTRFVDPVCIFKIEDSWGAWEAQPMKQLPLAQVVTPRVLGWSPAFSALLSTEPASPAPLRLPLLVLSLNE